MRPLWKDVLVAVWLGMLLPGIVLNAFVYQERKRELQHFPAQQVQQDTSQCILVRDPDGILQSMDLDVYLTGVLLAEMPADFHTEALKAQSVAARTYTWKAHTTGGKHGDGSICTDSACCQAYLPAEVYLSRGGTSEKLEKVKNAVRATSSMVLVYQGELIEATYFSSSGGNTEAAQAVWGADFPYLQSVSSPETVLEASVSFTPEEFQKYFDRELTGDPAQWFGPVMYTEGGGVASMDICGVCHTGVELRSLLGLRSTAFQIRVEDSVITVTTRGYGHRVGMSQHGANAMANSGSNYQKILQHYYPGTNLVPMP